MNHGDTESDGSQGSGRVRFALRSVTGPRARNEDSVLALGLDEGRWLFAVADGMGGHRAGDIASRIAVDTLERGLAGSSGSAPTLVDAVRNSNRAVWDAGLDRSEWAGMGTTLTALLIEGSEYRIAHVGDSRAYRLDQDGFRALTHDHTAAVEARRSGTLDPEEARGSRLNHLLIRAIGADREVEVDQCGPYSLNSEATFLLCSDGLTGRLGDDRIRALLEAGGSLERSCDHLVDAALDAGSRDNISVVLIHFG